MIERDKRETAREFAYLSPQVGSERGFEALAYSGVWHLVQAIHSENAFSGSWQDQGMVFERSGPSGFAESCRECKIMPKQIRIIEYSAGIARGEDTCGKIE
jgi:hypothetical protein